MNMTTLSWKNALRCIVWVFPLLFFLACALNGEQVKGKDASTEKEETGNSILAISVSEAFNRTTVTIEAERPITYTTFRQMNPERMVVEISKGVWKKLEGPIEIEDSPIQKIVNRQLGSASKPLARMEILIKEQYALDARPQTNSLILTFAWKSQNNANKANPEKLEPLSRLDINEDETDKLQEYSRQQLTETKSSEPQKPANKSKISGNDKEARVSPVREIVDFLINRENGKTRIVLIGDGEFSDFNSFRVSEPDRVVIDIWDVHRLFRRSSFPGDGIYISNVRFGDHQDKIRIVIDLIQSEGIFCNLNKETTKLIFSIGKGIEEEENSILVADLPNSEPERIKFPQKTERDWAEEMAGGKLALTPAEYSSLSEENSPELEIGAPLTEPEVSAVAWSPKAKKENESLARSSALEGKDISLQGPSVQLQLTSLDSPSVTGFPEIHTGLGTGKIYVGRRVNLDFQDINIHNVFRLLAEVSNLNLVVDEKVKGRITMKLVNVPWDQALDLILATKDLGMIVDGNIRRIAPLKDLRRREKDIRKAIEERAKAKIKAEEEKEKAAIEAIKRQKALEPLVTETIFVNYAKVKDVENQFKGYLTEGRGKLISDERTNSFTITDVEETIQTIKKLLKRIDTATPQVMIEARIVQADTSFGRSLGIQWGTHGLWNDPNSERYVYAQYSGITTDYNPTVPASTPAERWTDLPVSEWAVNFPASAFPGVIPAAWGFKFGKLIGDLFSLDAKLSLAESEGLSRVISRPKISTIDNIQATIKSGESIPYETVSESGTQTTFVDAVLELTVTPHVTPDGKVKMDVMASKNSIGSFRSASGSPSIIKREATTQILVSNGETTVIGGIFEQAKDTSTAAVPWFSKIPILGWLFKSKTWNDRKSELLIFITPYIIKEASEEVTS
jgi:type IV pilus assembly protein PilQ